MQPPQPRGATAQGSVSERDWAVQPPLSRGSTARAQVSRRKAEFAGLFINPVNLYLSKIKLIHYRKY